MRLFALFLVVSVLLVVTVEGKRDKTKKGNRGHRHRPPVFDDGDDIEIEEGEDDATVTVNGKSHVVKKVKVEESDEGGPENDEGMAVKQTECIFTGVGNGIVVQTRNCEKDKGMGLYCM